MSESENLGIHIEESYVTKLCFEHEKTAYLLISIFISFQCLSPFLSV